MEWGLDFRMNTKSVERGTKDLIVLNGEMAKSRAWMLEIETKGGTAFVNMSLAAQQAGDVLKTGLAYGLGAVVAALGAGVVALDKFGDSAVAAFGERAAAIKAYTTLLGDSKQAELEFFKAQQLSQQTDLSAEATRKAQKGLVVSGFRGEGLDSTLLAGLDLATVAEDKNKALESFTSAVSKIRGADKLQQEQLNQLSEGAGLSQAKVKEEIGKLLGLTSKDAIAKALSGGKVGGDVGIAAIQNAVLGQLNTKKLGEFATGSAGSLNSLLSNRDEASKNLLQSFDSDQLPEVQHYKKSLASYTSALDVQTDTGRKLSIALQDLSNTSLGLKSAWEEFKTGFLESFADSYSDALEAFGVPLGETTDALKNTGDQAKEVGRFLGNLGYVVAALNRGVEHAGDLFGTLSDGMVEFWYYIRNPAKWLAGGEQGESWRQILGLGEKTRNAFDAPTAKPDGESEATYRARIAAEDAAAAGEDAGNALGRGIVKGARAATKTHSPSEEMRAFGKDLRAGLSLGLADSGADVSGSGGGGGGGVGDVTIGPIYVAAPAGADGREVAGMVAEEVEKLMRRLGRYSRNPGRGNA